MTVNLNWLQVLTMGPCNYPKDPRSPQKTTKEPKRPTEDYKICPKVHEICVFTSRSTYYSVFTSQDRDGFSKLCQTMECCQCRHRHALPIIHSSVEGRVQSERVPSTESRSVM